MAFALPVFLIVGHRTLPRFIIFHTLFILSFFLLLPSPISANASEFNISSETIFRIFERENQDDGKFSVIPVYEYIGVDYGDPEVGGLSLHANGWGRTDLGTVHKCRTPTLRNYLHASACYCWCFMRWPARNKMPMRLIMTRSIPKPGPTLNS